MPSTVNPSALAEALRQHFGYSEFRPLQEEIITTLLEGNDAFVLMPTGGGKSLCFQLPAILMSGVTVVISPLIALMKDQVDALTENGIAATFLNSSLTGQEIAERRRRLLDGEVRLLYIAPERLTGDFWDFLARLDLSLMAIDEAHCISEWGHDFRIDYRLLSRLRDRFPEVPMVAMTATANARVQEDIVAQLKLRPGTQRFIASFDRPNLFYEVRAKHGDASQLREIIERHRGESGIVYCQSRARAESLAAWLTRAGYRALPYHAGLPSEVRTEHQERFVRDDVEIICATIAFGMGIDKPDVRFVVHFDLPKNLMSYYQETGRAGRDGLPSECILCYSPGDRAKIMHFIQEKEDPVERAAAIEQLAEMTGYAESGECRRRILLGHFGEEYGEEKCGGCDNCANPDTVETVDVTRPAQMFLSCVVRVRQAFGVNHIIDVLRGSESARIHNYRHNLLPTFGIGRDLSKEEWRMLAQSLIRSGYLALAPGMYGTVHLSEKGAAFLRERQALVVKRPRELAEANIARRKAIDLPEPHLTLFERLRALRKQIADGQEVPAYAIFDNRTLIQLASTMPSSASEMIGLHGVGAAKAQHYGETFARAIAAFRREHPTARPIAAPSNAPRDRRERSRQGRGRRGGAGTESLTLELYNRGLDIEEIARERNLSANTIASHIEELVKTREIEEIDRLVDRNKIAAIESAFDTAGIGLLKPVREQLGEEYTYNEIRLVRAWVLAVKEGAEGVVKKEE